MEKKWSEEAGSSEVATGGRFVHLKGVEERMITIEVVHDLICPWCRIGEHHLDAALAQRKDVPVEIRLHAYQLAPEVPPEGVDYKQHLARKFGNIDRLEQMHARLRSIGASLGISFNEIQRLPNTLRGHALISAVPSEAQVPLLRALQQAYFEDGQDLGSADVLVQAAVTAGLSPNAAQAALDGADIEAARRDAREMAQLGVTGVPTFIFNRRYQVVGAQPPEQLVRVIDMLSRPGSQALG
jgi:predicted DsbA family dithiol-disulfide isomerase